MYKFPLSIPYGQEIEITQPFKSTALVDYYRSQGLNITEHDAVDVRVKGVLPVGTYGIPFVCPFPRATLNSYGEADPVNGIGGRVLVEYMEPDGTSLVVGGIHLSGTVKQNVYKEGEVLGYVGNYGYVVPAPTIGTPFAGSHIHLTLVKKKLGELNGTVIDPLLYFDVNNPYRSADTGIERDKYGIMWAIKKIKLAIKKITG